MSASDNKIYSEDPVFVIIDGIRHVAVDDSEDDHACESCSLRDFDCRNIRCGRDERCDKRSAPMLSDEERSCGIGAVSGWAILEHEILII